MCELTYMLFTLPSLSDRSASLAMAFKTMVVLTMILGTGHPALADEGRAEFRRIPVQFIAALAAPDASAGSGAQNWGLWRRDPGPRGVELSRYPKLQAAGNVAPAGWRFDAGDWWLEENGLIMEPPEFPLAPGKYLVTGDREVTAVLTIYPPDASGDSRWALENHDGGDRAATLYDVTHLGCRSARYTPVGNNEACSPAGAPLSAFRVPPGAAMPPVSGCNKQDYAVLFVIGVEK
jgi:hypothetical protein